LDVVVYLPIAVLTTGIPRQFLAPFAVVITVATLTSLVVSFTLTPLLASRFLKRELAQRPARPSLWSRFGLAWDRAFGWLEHGYERLLRRALPHRWIVIFLGGCAFAGGISLAALGFIGYDFFPAGDQSELDINLAMPPATSLEATDATARAIEADLRARPEVRSVYTIVGQS